MNKLNEMVSIIIPVLNEGESIQQLYSEIKQNVAGFPRYEIVFVDDGSTDDSLEVIESLKLSDSNVKLIQFYKNYGKAEALSAGFNDCQGDYVITMDADLQDDPNEINALVNKLKEGWDVVSGWKKSRNDPLSKKFPSKIFNLITRLFTGIQIHDFNCGLKAYRSSVVKSIELYGGLHRYIPAIAKQKGFSVTEIVVNHRPRKHGETKYGGARYFHGFFDLLTILFMGKYFNRPLHFFGFIGLILTVAGLGINTWLTIGWFRGVWIGNRPILFLAVLLMVVGIQFFSIGLLGEMIVKSQREKEQKIQRVLTGSPQDEHCAD
ncbi:MAG: glycosyltransferase family 2 protein [Candidatus Marinimicrobia bacterium]|nr:glycosyltransferase family 2 protein [Candidatus Neomarinimicrobiota bacterium]